MRKPYLISYDLNKPGQNYESLIARLRELGAVRILLSQWALSTSYTPVELRDDLKRYMDANDRLLVTQIGNWAWFNITSSEQFNKIAA